MGDGTIWALHYRNDGSVSVNRPSRSGLPLICGAILNPHGHGKESVSGAPAGAKGFVPLYPLC